MLARCRKIAAAVTLATGCIYSGNLLALGLGQLTVNSSLNEPLDAEIQLLGLDGLNIGQILTSMGGMEDFERANVERVGLIDDIMIDVEIFDRQTGVLHLTSTDPVIEPFLNMVINVRWPNGRLVRDYTALIDLPVFSSNDTPAAPVDVPRAPATSPEPEQTPEPAPEPRVFAADEPAVTQPVAPAEEESPTVADAEPEMAPTADAEPEAEREAESAAGEVAMEDEAPDATAVEDQAIDDVEAAPEPEPEPDVLSASADDEMPAPETAAQDVAEPEAPEDVVVEAGDTLYAIAAANRPDTSVSVEQTMIAIQRANGEAFTNDNINMIQVGKVLRIPAIQDIRSIDQAQAVRQIALQNQAAAAQPIAVTANDGATTAPGADELTILSGDAGTEPTGDSDLAATIDALENQLAISEENLDRARLENQELRSRYAKLEEQIEILQNIIAMQDTRLAQLQADLAAEAEAEALAEDAAEVPAPVAAVPDVPVRDNSLMGQLSAVFENTLVLLSSLVALILLVVGFLVWRRRAAQVEMDEFELGQATAAASPEAFTADEPEGASAGFLAALKARFARGEDQEDAGEDDEIAVADDEDDAVQAVDDEAQSPGLLARLKGLFGRSSADDEDDEDDEAAYYEDDDPDEADDGDDEPVDQDQTALADEDEQDTDEFADLDDDDDYAPSADEDLEDDDTDELLNELAGEAGWPDEDAADDDLQDDDDEEAVALASDRVMDDDSDELTQAPADSRDGGSEDNEESFDFDLGEFDMDADDADDGEAGETRAQADEFSLDDFDDLDVADADQGDDTAAAPEPVAAPDDDEDDVFDLGEFDLDDAGSGADETTETDDTAEVAFDAPADDDRAEVSPDDAIADEAVREVSDELAQTGAGDAADTEDDTEAFEFSLDESAEPAPEPVTEDTAEDVEAFDFSLDEVDAPVADEDARREDAGDVESFEFTVTEPAPAAPQAEAADEADEDVETLDFDVSAVSSFEEDTPAATTDEAGEPEDLETFDFTPQEDATPAGDDETLAPGADDSQADAGAEAASGDDDQSMDSLAAALDEIDAEAAGAQNAESGQGGDDDDVIDLDDDLDLGNIDIDDSLFEADDDDTTEAPISDRDESSTKLDLAVAYEAMGDLEGAREILNEVIAEGSDDQVAEARKLLEKWEQS